MSGKHEKERQIEWQISKMLCNMPLILTDYYYNLIDSGKSCATAQKYLYGVIQFAKFTYGSVVKEDFYLSVTSNRINRYIDSFRTINADGKTGDASSSSKANSWTALNSFFQFLVPDYISVNPVSSIKRPKMEKISKVVFLTPEEMTGIFENIITRASVKQLNRDLSLFKLGFATGLQVSDIVQIDIDDLDLSHNQIRIEESGNLHDNVIVGENLKKQISLWLKDREKFFCNAPTNALFVSQENKRLSTRSIRDLLEKYADGATDKHISPDVMRRTCAMNLYQKTGDICLCAKQLRHKDISTTLRYLGLQDEKEEKQQKAVDILDDLI